MSRDDLTRLVGELPREALPALLTALAARLLETEAVAPPTDASENGHDPDRLLDADAVALRLGIDVASVSRRNFPFRVKVGRRTYRYRAAGLESWIAKGGTF